MIPEDKGIHLVPEFPDNFGGIGAVADHVAQTDNAIHAVGLDVLVNYLPGLHIGMEI